MSNQLPEKSNKNDYEKIVQKLFINNDTMAAITIIPSDLSILLMIFSIVKKLFFVNT